MRRSCSGAGSMVFLRWEGAAEATASLSIMRRKGAGYTYTVRRKGRTPSYRTGCTGGFLCGRTYRAAAGALHDGV